MKFVHEHEDLNLEGGEYVILAFPSSPTSKAPPISVPLRSSIV